MRLPIVVNLLGGPGIGKSTIAVGVYYNLKKRGLNVELATEVAKDEIYNGSENLLHNQPYIFGLQQNRLWRLQDKVDVIVADSPLVLSIIYSRLNSENFNNFVVEEFNKFNNYNYILNRNDDFYTENGRVHTLEESKKIDKQIVKLLEKYDIDYIKYDTEFAVEHIVDDVMKNIKNIKK